MAEKLHEYQGIGGRVHGVRDKAKEKWDDFKQWKDQIPTDRGLEGVITHLRGPPKLERSLEDYAHIYRKKTRWELVRVSAAVMGIEFSYAAETAFVSPTLLKIGVDHQHMTLVWALSPLVGFFVTPLLGSLSDRCRLKQGRRRPFIALLAIGVLMGLILVPNGEGMGYAFGDVQGNYTASFIHRITGKTAKVISDNATMTTTTTTIEPPLVQPSHSWGIFFTILGTVLLDFDADACQSPARAYLLDVTIPEDHARGLSTFTIMAGLGGFMGYGLGGINWDATRIGVALGGHLHAVFTLITFIFIFCVASTLTSFKEIPLIFLESEECQQQLREMELPMKELPPQRKAGAVPMIPDVKSPPPPRPKPPPAAAGGEASADAAEAVILDSDDAAAANPKATLQEYLYSILYMPHSMRMVCLTNLCCWMAHVCYSLYFTDFVGEAVYGGDPKGAKGLHLRPAVLQLRNDADGPDKHPFGVILFSWTAGVMYSTLFTMPYLLIAHYHAENTFAVDAHGASIQESSVRGLGTDVAIVSSMVFLAQFLLSCVLGTIVSVSGTTTAVVCVASTLAACGALAATQIMYLDL
ncbi:unnamed protein product [Trichogramma brassicae]|uniref:Major facilitator superfamily (MFS) profile domain-containing protein n=1 Tax=Trichogramma brassicae TaxID=86971 RepID=A0A6H5IHY2_9HYME|nr:unnamed protein product [Trichogramma brassicae]